MADGSREIGTSFCAANSDALALCCRAYMSASATCWREYLSASAMLLRTKSSACAACSREYLSASASARCAAALPSASCAPIAAPHESPIPCKCWLMPPRGSCRAEHASPCSLLKSWLAT